MTLPDMIAAYALGAVLMLLYAGWANRAEDLRSPLFVALVSALCWPFIAPLLIGEAVRGWVRRKTT